MQEFYKMCQFWGTKIAITPPNINIFCSTFFCFTQNIILHHLKLKYFDIF